jgi:hypothetical protein
MRRAGFFCCLLAMCVVQWVKPLQWVECGVCYQHRWGLSEQSGDCHVQLYPLWMCRRKRARVGAGMVRQWLLFCRVRGLCLFDERVLCMLV